MPLLIETSFHPDGVQKYPYASSTLWNLLVM